MQATQKFDRGSSKDGGKRGRKRREEDEPWKGSEDVEKLSAIFTSYLTSVGNRRQGGNTVNDESPKTVKNNMDEEGQAAAAQ